MPAKEYKKPHFTSKKIKLSFFLSNIFWLDQFNLVGDVYAQSGNCTNCESACSQGANSGCGCANSQSCGQCGANEPGGGNCGGCGCGCSRQGIPTSITGCQQCSYACGCSSGNDANGGSGGHGGY